MLSKYDHLSGTHNESQNVHGSIKKIVGKFTKYTFNLVRIES